MIIIQKKKNRKPVKKIQVLNNKLKFSCDRVVTKEPYEYTAKKILIRKMIVDPAVLIKHGSNRKHLNNSRNGLPGAEMDRIFQKENKNGNNDQ
jgi:hypothetical protein